MSGRYVRPLATFTVMPPSRRLVMSVRQSFDFDEDKHPRGPDGHFLPGTGEHTNVFNPKLPAQEAVLHEVEAKVGSGKGAQASMKEVAAH